MKIRKFVENLFRVKLAIILTHTQTHKFDNILSKLCLLLYGVLSILK